jgi:hypothetical protein
MTGINDTNAKPEEMSDLDKEDRELTKEEHAINFAKVLSEIERSIEPFKEHKRDVKKMYEDNLWLSKTEQTAISKAFRSLKKDEDFTAVVEYLDLLKKNNVKV